MTDTTALDPDYILGAVLVNAQRLHGSSNRLRFRGYDFKLQQIFHELSSCPDFPLLSAFVFSDSGPEPYSPILNDSVSTLQLGGLLGRQNPDYEILFLNPSAEAFFDEVLAKELSTDQKAQLEKIAEAFLQKVDTISDQAA